MSIKTIQDLNREVELQTMECVEELEVLFAAPINVDELLEEVA